MAAISQTTLSNAYSWKDIRISINISLKFVPYFPSIGNIPALVQMMAWRRPGDKPIFEYKLWLDYWRINASLGINELIQIHLCVDLCVSGIILV